MGSAAAWRTQPLSHMDMLARIRHQGDRINPLLQLPWIETKCFRPDWLHVADLGVTADFIGNALKILEPLCPGPSRAARVSFLNIWMQDWYDRNHIEDRLNVLLPELFIQRNKGYKLRAGAAKARVLVPWIDHVCQTFFHQMTLYMERFVWRPAVSERYMGVCARTHSMQRWLEIRVRGSPSSGWRCTMLRMATTT